MPPAERFNTFESDPEMRCEKLRGKFTRLQMTASLQNRRLSRARSLQKRRLKTGGDLRANLNAAVRDSRWSLKDDSHGNGCRNHLATLRRLNAHL